MLPTPPARRHVNIALDLTTLADISAAYAELAARPLADADQLASWLRAWSELESLLDEDQTVRAVALSRSTDDPAALIAHLDFVDRIAPHCKPLRDGLARRLVAHPHAHALDPAEHAQLLRKLATHVELYSPALAPLEAEEQHLLADYQQRRTAMTTDWDGEPRTLEFVEAVLDDPDRDRREHAWRSVTARYELDRPALDAVFDRLLAVRQQQADTAGCPDVRSHRFRLLARFDYTPDDCLALHDAIAERVVPLASQLLARRASDLGLASTRPWDLTAPRTTADASRPFTDEPTLIAGCTRALRDVDPEFADQFASLARAGLLDLMARPGKAPGGYQVQLEATGLPFVFANAVGRREDLWTVLHEAGHALHALATAAEPLTWNRTAPLEFCEVASMAMELMAGSHLESFFDESASRAARREQLEQIVLFLPHMACIDAFQHWLYTDPLAATWAGARDVVWSDLHTRFFPTVDWSGLELPRSHLWQRQVHVFTDPFYYIEYGIAQLGALQLYERYLAEPTAAVAAYRRALALGGRAGLRDLFGAADLDFDLTPESVGRRMDFVTRELTRLGA